MGALGSGQQRVFGLGLVGSLRKSQSWDHLNIIAGFGQAFPTLFSQPTGSEWSLRMALLELLPHRWCSLCSICHSFRYISDRWSILDSCSKACRHEYKRRLSLGSWLWTNQNRQALHSTSSRERCFPVLNLYVESCLLFCCDKHQEQLPFGQGCSIWSLRE